MYSSNLRGALRATLGFLLLLGSVTLHAQEPTRTDSLAQRRDTVTLPEIEVIGSRPRALDQIPGSGQVVTEQELMRSRVFTTNEALRKVPGLDVRDEEGFGLRPNIGVRGLNPTRSSKVLLLEDGVPFTIAPYGANESYYHPPIDRFSRIEVLKGSGQILFGPQTIGGVINYVTPEIPRRLAGSFTLTGGNRDYLNAHGRIGGQIGKVGLLLDVARKQGDGARENVGAELSDVSVKSSLQLGSRQSLTLRAGFYDEHSQVTYSGLTESEYAANPFANPFVNDSMLLSRWGGAVSHRLAVAPGADLVTTVYGYHISRDWWRQSSNSGERPNDSSDPACVGMTNLSTTCGNQGRLRDYTVGGIEPRFSAGHTLFGVAQRLDAGIRVHLEDQERRQWNASTPDGRTAGDATNVNAGVRERNHRSNQAYSAFLQNRFATGRWTVTPGLRVEHVRYERRNELAVPEVEGRTSLTKLIPGLGATYQLGDATTLFAGVHRGFAPPRTEDLIDNSTGAVVDLDAELSWNYEVGVRARPARGMTVEATAFQMNFDNQVIPASVAGGTGATLTSAGQTLHRGTELSGRIDLGVLARSASSIWLSAAWTWLATARFEGDRFAYIGTGGSDVVGKVYAGQGAGNTRQQVSVSGNRLPYAPEHLLTAAVGWGHPAGLELQFEGVHSSRQYGDPVNTSVLVADGQQGPIGAFTIFNATASWRFRFGTTVFGTVKNLFDRTYVVDRTRGLLPGSPRLVQAGVSQTL